jgi:hypothetical protein
VEEHEKHLKTMFKRLRDNQLYLKWKKCQLYTKEIECLGHMIDDNGIHPDTNKLDIYANGGHLVITMTCNNS